MKKIIVGSRGSLLALRQSEIVIQTIKKIYPEQELVIKKIKTTGDKIIDSPLSKLVSEPGGTKGLFTKEIEEALLRKEVDFAVHSMKDLPTELPGGLVLGAIPKREKIYDVLLTKDGKKFSGLPAGAKIGTSSLRRKAQLLASRPDLEIVDLRGNLNTRLRKLKEQDLAGIIVAYAGLERMGYPERKEAEILDFILPAVGQGAIGIEIRENDRRISELIESLNDQNTATCILAERAFLRRLGGGCQVPIGIKSELLDSQLILEGIVLSEDGKKHFQDKVSGLLREATNLGTNLAEKLISAGAKELLASL